MDLGKLPDHVVASKYNKNLPFIRKTRRGFGIQRYWPDNIKKTFDISSNKELIQMLGTMSDSEIAKLFASTKAAISRIRTRLNIPPFNQNIAETQKWEANREKAISLLGELSNAQLARKFGGRDSRYAYLRKKLGIPTL